MGLAPLVFIKFAISGAAVLAWLEGRIGLIIKPLANETAASNTFDRDESGLGRHLSDL